MNEGHRPLEEGSTGSRRGGVHPRGGTVPGSSHRNQEARIARQGGWVGVN